MYRIYYIIGCIKHLELVTSSFEICDFSTKFTSNHRIGLVVLEGTFKVHPVQSPCNEQGNLQLDQVAQSPVQSDLQCLQ